MGGRGGNRPEVWAPRHRGWKLAHHLVPAFAITGFVAALAVASAVLGSWAFAAAMLAIAAGFAVSLVREFRQDPEPVPPRTAAVETTTGARAATHFAMLRGSVPFAATTVGLGVVAGVAALALAARRIADPAAGWVVVVAAAGLLAVAFLVLREGLRLMRIASSDHPAGVYLTRSRVVLYGPQGRREVYWRDVSGVSAEDPPGRAPLGKRGPALIVVRHAGPKPLIVPVQYLACDPNRLLAALRHYAGEGADRPELGTPAALERFGRAA